MQYIRNNLDKNLKTVDQRFIFKTYLVKKYVTEKQMRLSFSVSEPLIL